MSKQGDTVRRVCQNEKVDSLYNVILNGVKDLRTPKHPFSRFFALLGLYLNIIRAVMSEADDKMKVFFFFDTLSKEMNYLTNKE